MTVLELAIFMCVYRGKRALLLDDVTPVLSGWFECDLLSAELAVPVSNMLGRGWLSTADDRLQATRDGREIARPLMNGIIRMLDQGTRLIDVALMMAVLRLTKGELDDER